LNVFNLLSIVHSQGIDWGGLRREWVELICASLFEPKGGFFCTFHDKRQALVHPNPNRPSHLKLKYYEFAGKIVGKCLQSSFHYFISFALSSISRL
jgi:apoptosis-resistant E3 ubiquitin protein ligase 1